MTMIFKRARILLVFRDRYKVESNDADFFRG